MTEIIINLNKLRPGDIILTGGNKGQSKVVQHVTGGHYSHAAIMLTNTLVFESVGEGLGFNAIKPIAIWREENKTTLFGKLSHTSKFLCLRHQNCPKSDEFTQKLMVAMLPFWGLEYPKLEALLDAVEQLRKYPLLFKGAKKIVGKCQKDIEYPGPFCSQLVSEIYASLDMQLFTSRLNTYVAPSDFTESKVLQQVDCRAKIPSAAVTDDSVIDAYNYLCRKNWITEDQRKLITKLHTNLGNLIQAFSAKRRILEEITKKESNANEFNSMNRRFIYSQNLPRLIMYCHLERKLLKKTIMNYPNSELFVDLLDQMKNKMNKGNDAS